MSTSPPLEIDCQALHSLLQGEGPPLLVDCREQDEWELVRIEGARLLPMSQLPQGLEQIEAQRAGPIVVYCHHGMRSQQVATWLRQQGYSQAQSLAGGIDAWSQHVDPSLPRY